MDKIEIEYLDLYEILAAHRFDLQSENPMSVHDFCEINFKKYQPESSKREDLYFCEYCDEEKSKGKILGFICKQCMEEM